MDLKDQVTDLLTTMDASQVQFDIVSDVPVFVAKWNTTIYSLAYAKVKIVLKLQRQVASSWQIYAILATFQA